MKKILFICFIFLFGLKTFSQTSRFNRNKTSKVSCTAAWAKMKTETELMPEAQGYTHVKEDVIGGIRCYHYEKGDKKCRVFKKDNGDFFVTDEDEYALARAPKSDCRAYAWKITLDNKDESYGYVTKHMGEFFSQILAISYDDISYMDEIYDHMYIDTPTRLSLGGVIIYQDRGNLLGSSFRNCHWDIFCTGHMTDDYYKKSKIDLFYGNIDRGSCIAFKENPKTIYEYQATPVASGMMGFGPQSEYGFVIGDRLYRANKNKDGIGSPIMQCVNGEFFYASENDTIINTKRSGNSLTLEYVNGDQITFVTTDHGTHVNGSLHRNGGVVKLNYSGSGVPQYAFVSEKPLDDNGSTLYIGTFEEGKDYTYGYLGLMFSPLLTIDTGTLENSNGVKTKIIRGKTEKQLQYEAQKRSQEEEAKEKARKADQMKRFTAKYGAAYTKALLDKGEIQIGMPFQLIKDYMDEATAINSFARSTSRIYDLSCTLTDIARFGKSVRKYQIMVNLIRQTIWVVNGKVAAKSEAYLF